MALQDCAIKMVKVTVRAYNAEGYSKDLAVMSDRQVHMTDGRVDGSSSGIGVKIDPKEFPEMTRFEVFLENVY
jgi:hypothetical protein